MAEDPSSDSSTLVSERLRPGPFTPAVARGRGDEV